MFLFGGSKPTPEYNFHNDETLHDQTPGLTSLGVQDIVPGIKLALTKRFNPDKLATVVKTELPKLDINDPLSHAATKGLVTKLWGSMQHPPLTYRGDEFQYRSVDGSNNNIMYPSLGKAGLPYAKSVQGTRAMHGARPDPGDLFDLLMARNDNGDESHVGISSLLLYQATLVIHDIFRTDDDDINKSKTSSYLDLAPLYGNTRPEQEAVRLMKDGLLKPDTFAEDRLLNQPPGVCIFIIMYNRFHNYVAQQLLEINENGKFTLPPGYGELAAKPESDREYTKDITEVQFKAALKKQDEDLFQTARLITCALYAQIAIHDYLRCLMRMHEKDTPWTLDPRKPYPEADNKHGLQRGEGNMVSVEFNMLYRFHSPLSERDRWWSEEAFIKLLKFKPGYVAAPGEKVSDEDVASGKKITEEGVREGQVPVPVFQHLLSGLKKMTNSKEYVAAKAGAFWPEGLDRVSFDTNIPGKADYRFKRDPKTGKFDDAQLAAEMIRVMEDPICHFGARQIPKVFRSIEVLGILQARKWELATLNEFREFFGMSRHKNFEDINTDPEIQNALRDLYEDPDQVELYPGVYCEGNKRNLDPDEKMPNDDGAALWRGIFSDAVTLVRSDRFYTIDWNVQSLTSWGMREVMSDPKVNKGSCFHRLFQRALPGYFTYNSLHMWQPFFTPIKNAYLALEQGYIDQLDLSGLEWIEKGTWTGKAADHTSKNFYSEIRACVPDLKKPPTKGLRRKLRWEPKWGPNGEKNDLWRGNELATLAANPVIVRSYKDIKNEILGGPSSTDFVSPAILEPKDIPYGPLRKILTHTWSPWADVLKIVNQTLKEQGHNNDNDKFLAYFVGLSQDIRRREERSFQYIKGQSPWEQKRKPEDTKKENEKKIKQLDVVKDYSIPVVSRFIADFLGFYDRVKTDKNKEALQREFNENQIYQHIQNCQNLESFDSDRTKTLERRQAFQKSIVVLHELAQHGVAKSERYLLWPEEPSVFSHGRYYGDPEEYRDQPYVIAVRKIGVKIIQALERKWGRAEVAAIMLATALDAAHKVVLTFTEIMAYFVDPKQQADTQEGKKAVFDQWANLQKLARQDTADSNNMIRKYVLEAQRMTHSLMLSRVYTPASAAGLTKVKGVKIDQYGEEHEVTIQRGDTVLLDLYKASHDKSIWQNPEEFDLNRKTTYLIYGNDIAGGNPESSAPTFSKRLSLTALTGMLKHAAMLKNLRVAHDKLGRLKKVKTPYGLRFDFANIGNYEKIKTLGGLERYCSTQWDVLLPAPATWNLRYDNLGEGVFRGPDNADQGHGINQLEGLILSAATTKTNEDKASTIMTKSYTYTTSDTVKSSIDRGVSVITTQEVHANY